MTDNDGFIKDSALPPLRRLIASAEGRSAITGEGLGVKILPSQIAIRGMFLAKSTANAEMSALRAFLHGLAHGTDDPNRDLIEEDHDWLRGVRVQELSEALRESTVPPSGYADQAQAYREMFRKGVRGRNLDGLSDEELLRQVSGVRKENPDKVVNKENKSLLWRDYLTIMMDLSEYDPDEAMTTLVETGVFTPGVARVAIAALYLTGCRPIELFGVNLYVPRIDVRYSDEKRHLTRYSPISAIHEGILLPIGQESKNTGLTRGQVLKRAVRMTGAAPVLSILSAKQQNANKDLRFPIRFMILDGISIADANLLAWATEFRNADKSDAARRRISTQSSAILRSICAANPEMRQDVTLYTFRHSFATRARNMLEEHECSALTGHTASRTFRGYGERAPRKTGGGWIPKPDPERAGMIQEIWNGLVISAETLGPQQVAVVTPVETPAVQVETEAPVKPPRPQPTSLPDVIVLDPIAETKKLHDRVKSIMVLDPDTGEEVGLG